MGISEEQSDLIVSGKDHGAALQGSKDGSRKLWQDSKREVPMAGPG